jgi:N-acetylglucosamine-6-sulfatase
VVDGRPFLDAFGLTVERRADILLEWAVDPAFGYLEWASLRGADWQYVEYYESDGQTVSFREYYDLTTDPYQLENLLADADPANDPDVTTLSTRLAGARRCAGNDAGAPAPCP